MRGKSLSRLMHLRTRVESGRNVNMRELAAELGCSVRTLYRDLYVLEENGVPLVAKRQGQRAFWQVLEEPRRRAALGFSLHELLALLMARGVMEGLGSTPFGEALREAFHKVELSVPPPRADRARALGTRVVGQAGLRQETGRGPAIAVLVDAIEDRHTVKLTYRKGAVRTERELDPHYLFAQSGALYVHGWCHLRQNAQTFHVGRIEFVEDTGTSFRLREEIGLSDVVHGAFGPWRGKAERVRLRFAPAAAAWVAERVWHPSQATRMREDGRLDVELQMPLAPALVAWVAGFGGQVQVVGPARLREAVRRVHEEALAADPV